MQKGAAEAGGERKKEETRGRRSGGSEVVSHRGVRLLRLGRGEDALSSASCSPGALSASRRRRVRGHALATNLVTETQKASEVSSSLLWKERPPSTCMSPQLLGLALEKSGHWPGECYCEVCGYRSAPALYPASHGQEMRVIRLQAGESSARRSSTCEASGRSRSWACSCEKACQRAILSCPVVATYYTGSISCRPGNSTRLSPARPKCVWKTSTMSPGRSAIPPSSGSCGRQRVSGHIAECPLLGISR